MTAVAAVALIAKIAGAILVLWVVGAAVLCAALYAAYLVFGRSR